MSSLKKFNSTLDSFDKEVENLKSVSESYKKLESLVKTFDRVNDLFVKHTAHLQSIVDAETKHHQTMSDGIIALKLQHAQHRSELEKQLTDKLGLISKQSITNKAELEKLFIEKNELIRKENKEFYRDLESTVKIKLDDHKSEIKQFIEAERIRIKEIIESEAIKTNQNINDGVRSIKKNIFIFALIIILIELGIIIIKLKF